MGSSLKGFGVIGVVIITTLTLLVGGAVLYLSKFKNPKVSQESFSEEPLQSENIQNEGSERNESDYHHLEAAIEKNYFTQCIDTSRAQSTLYEEKQDIPQQLEDDTVIQIELGKELGFFTAFLASEKDAQINNLTQGFMDQRAGYSVRLPQGWKRTEAGPPGSFIEFSTSTIHKTGDLWVTIERETDPGIFPRCSGSVHDYLPKGNSSEFLEKTQCRGGYYLTLRLRRDDQNSDTHKKLLEKIANNFYPIDEDFLRNRGARPSVVFDNLATDVLIRVQLMGNKKIPPKGILRLIKYTSIQEDIYDDLGPLYDTGMDGDEIVNDGVFSKKISVKESGPKPLFFGFILVVPDSMVPTRLHDLLLPVAIRQDPECVVDSFVADLRSGDIESAGKKVGERVKEGLSTIDQSALLKLADSIERRTLEEPKEDSAKWYRSDSRSYEIPWDDADGPGSLSISLFRDALGIWSIQF